MKIKMNIAENDNGYTNGIFWKEIWPYVSENAAFNMAEEVICKTL